MVILGNHSNHQIKAGEADTELRGRLRSISTNESFLLCYILAREILYSSENSIKTLKRLLLFSSAGDRLKPAPAKKENKKKQEHHNLFKHRNLDLMPSNFNILSLQNIIRKMKLFISTNLQQQNHLWLDNKKNEPSGAQVKEASILSNIYRGKNHDVE